MGGVEEVTAEIGFRIEPLAESDSGRVREQAAESGYLFVRGLVDADSVLALRDAALSIAAELGWLAADSAPGDGIARPGIRLGIYDDPDWVQFQQRVLPLPEFIALGENPAILRVLEELFGESVMTRRGDICRVDVAEYS